MYQLLLVEVFNQEKKHHHKTLPHSLEETISFPAFLSTCLMSSKKEKKKCILLVSRSQVVIEWGGSGKDTTILN